MNPIKHLREASGYTQLELADKSGLSLRTIQRLETDDKAPKGHSLKMLANTFGLEPVALQEQFIPLIPAIENTDKLSISLINLSVLGFFIFPFGNIVFPFLVWRKKRTSKRVDEMGRKIISFQIFWTVGLVFLLSISPFINLRFLAFTPLILYVLFTCLAINVVVICLTARSIQREEMDFPQLPFALI